MPADNALQRGGEDGRASIILTLQNILSIFETCVGSNSLNAFSCLVTLLTDASSRFLGQAIFTIAYFKVV